MATVGTKPYSFDRRGRLPLTDRQQAVFSLFGAEHVSTRELVDATGLSRQAVESVLSSLALRGLIGRRGSLSGWVRL